MGSGFDLFADRASMTMTGTNGNTQPSQGTVETWTGITQTTFPAANSSGIPPTQFRIIDRDLPTEIMVVTNISSQTNGNWTVIRAAENTQSVAHATGWTVQQVVTAGGMDNRYAPVYSAAFEQFVRYNSLDQMTQPQGDVFWNNFRLRNLGIPQATTDAGTARNALLAELWLESASVGTTFATSSTTPALVDSTYTAGVDPRSGGVFWQLPVTPISTNLVVELGAIVEGTPASSQPWWGVCLNRASPGTLAGYAITAPTVTTGNAGVGAMAYGRIRITSGLTAGTPVNLSWVWGLTTGTSTATMTSYCHGAFGIAQDNGPMYMRAFAD